MIRNTGTRGVSVTKNTCVCVCVKIYIYIYYRILQKSEFEIHRKTFNNNILTVHQPS